jgi:hypothetical protein
MRTRRGSRGGSGSTACSVPAVTMYSASAPAPSGKSACPGLSEINRAALANSARVAVPTDANRRAVLMASNTSGVSVIENVIAVGDPCESTAERAPFPADHSPRKITCTPFQKPTLTLVLLANRSCAERP